MTNDKVQMRLSGALLAIGLLFSPCLAMAANGLSQRFANTTLTLPQQPAQAGYQVVNAFGSVTFTQPTCIQTPPGETNRVFVLEKMGHIQVVTNIGAVNPTKSQYMDLSANLSISGEQGLLGLAFHPGFQSNGLFFIYRSVNVSTGVTERLSRFQASPPSAPTASAATEVILFDQLDLADNHNGGDLHFGADGYLYNSVGDGGNQDDSLKNSQTIRKGLHSGMLRIDVDKRAGNLPPNAPSSITSLFVSTNYAIPADNPWVSNSFPYEVNTSVSPTNTRTEFWAVGLRNPWRYSFDPVTGWLWEGDVGGSLREEVNILVKGGDYGWAYREGTINGPKSAQAPNGFSSINPIFEYAHGTTPTNTGNSITGGLVYRGANLSELTGAYIFADYVNGWIWALRYDGTTVSDFHNLLQNGAPLKETGIVAFGLDPRNGDVLMADYDSSMVRRLALTNSGNALPSTLADTGAFSDVAALTPQSGIVPYSLNVPFWSDNAIKTRWFSVPNTNLTMTWTPSNNWSYPTGGIWIKHFELVTNELTQQRTRLETRFIVRNSNGVYGVTYRWGGNPNNATLVDAGGMTEPFVITGAGGTVRTQNWYYPSRADCLTCHSAVGGLVLGFHTAQLNRDHTYTNFPGATGATDNQLRTLSAAGYFSAPITEPTNLPALANWNDSSATLEWRVRSYLAANCVQCHQPGGLALGYWDARYYLSTEAAALVWGPLVNNFGNTNSHVITPHSLTNSMLYQRIGGFTGTRMPPLATSVLDTNDMNLLANWIGTLDATAPPVQKTYTLISTGSVWRFNDSATDLGTAWHAISYPDSGWKSGPAQLGFGDGDEATLVTSNGQWTTYFRRSFVLPDTRGFAGLTVRLLRDDGGVVYLNDTEIFRNNMPNGTIVYSTAASTNVGGADESINFYSTNLSAVLLRTGTNTVAVEIHQNNLGSTDLSFDLALIATALVSQPTVSISLGTGSGFTLAWPSDPGFFDIYTATNLNLPIAWSRATNSPLNANGQWMLSIPAATNASRFYRLQSK